MSGQATHIRAKKILWILVPVVILITLLILAVIRVKPASKQRTIVVPDDYSRIDWAVGNATEGDTIFVKSGIYLDQSFCIDKPLSLLGEDSKTTILRGYFPSFLGPPGYFPPNATIIHLNADNVRISRFTFENAICGISGSGNRVQITDNIFKRFGDWTISLSGSNNVISRNLFEIVFAGVNCRGSHNTISDNIFNKTFSSGHVSIEVHGANNTIARNKMIDDAYGISVLGDFNIIAENNITRGLQGIAIGTGSHNIICRNVVTGTFHGGIFIGSGFNNTIYENHVANNQYGITMGGFEQYVENNTVYRNNFISNTRQVRTDWIVYGVNYWDNGREGNYWSDYNGADTNGDGIGDTPYIIDENNIDRYPLMNPVKISEPTSGESTNSVIDVPLVTRTIVVSAIIAIAMAIFCFTIKAKKQKSKEECQN
jgi:nitrous oxidase accessory protein NosD